MAKDSAPKGRVEMGGREAKTKNIKGRVRVYLSMTDPETKKPVTDNVTAALYVNGATIGEVASAIQKALS